MSAELKVGWAGYPHDGGRPFIVGPVSEMTLAIACDADLRGRGGRYNQGTHAARNTLAAPAVQK